MENKIKVITWNQKDSGEPDAVYRLDDPESGECFFNILLDNAETDGRDIFEIKEITQQAWDEADLAGGEIA